MGSKPLLVTRPAPGLQRALKAPDLPASSSRCAVAPGLPFFCGDLLQALDRQRLLSHDPLESGVLVFALLQPSGFRNIHAAIFMLPAVKALLRNPVPLANFNHRRQRATHVPPARRVAATPGMSRRPA